MALRELKDRAFDNIVVTLYWNDEDDTLTVEAEDLFEPDNSRTISGLATPADARQAFDHPFTYAPREAVAV